MEKNKIIKSEGYFNRIDRNPDYIPFDRQFGQIRNQRFIVEVSQAYQQARQTYSAFCAAYVRLQSLAGDFVTGSEELNNLSRHIRDLHSKAEVQAFGRESGFRGTDLRYPKLKFNIYSSSIPSDRF